MRLAPVCVAKAVSEDSGAARVQIITTLCTGMFWAALKLSSRNLESNRTYTAEDGKVATNSILEEAL